MVGRNGPPLDGWHVTPRACPFDIADCRVCETPQQANEDHLVRGEN